MRELLTIQIIRPNFDDAEPAVKKRMIEDLARDIAKQITVQEDLRRQYQERLYWEQKLLDWEIEDELRRAGINERH